MRTLKKIKQAIAKKFKNWKGTTAPKETAIQEPNTSSSKDFLEEIEKPSESILNVETTIEQQILPPTVATETTIAGSCDNSNITIIEDQNIPIVDSVEETTMQELDASYSPSAAEIKPCDAVEEKSSTKTT